MIRRVHVLFAGSPTFLISFEPAAVA